MLPPLGRFLPPSLSCLHSLDDVDVWSALLICSIWPPEVERSSFLEHWPLYRVLTSLLGEILDVARYGPHGGKLCHLCQGSYIWSTQTKQNLRSDRHFIRNSNFNHKSWIYSQSEFRIRSQQCVETNISRRPFRQSISILYLSNMRYQLSFTSMYPCKQTNKQTTSDRLTVNHATVGITCNLQLYPARWNLSRMCKLTVIYSIVTCSLLYIPQDFPLFFIIFLTFPTTASHGYTNTTAQCDWIWIEPNNGRFIKCTPGLDTAAMGTAVCPPRRCNCSHQKYSPGLTFKNHTYNWSQHYLDAVCNWMWVSPYRCRRRSTINTIYSLGT